MTDTSRSEKIVSFLRRQETRLSPAGIGEGLRPQALRRRIVAASFVICVIIPALFGAFYYAFIASDRYVSGAGFAIRSMDVASGGDAFSTFTGIANAGSTSSDSYILLKYVKSRDIVERLEKDFSLRVAYSGKGDFLSRLDPEIDIENLVEYWAGVISTSFDNTSGIITFKVEAFTPEDAERIANLVLGYSRELFNVLSERARSDAVAYAEGEVARAETRLRGALERLRNFRENEQSIDPQKSAQLQIEIVGSLEKQLLETRARLSALEGTVDAESPSVRTLRRQAQALEEQMAAKQAEISKGSGAQGGQAAALSGLLAIYDTLEVERGFAQQAYASALSSLEKARVEAGRQQRYLAVYSTPGTPEYPLYPRRLLIVLLLTGGLAVIWSIGVLIAYSIRDHIS